MELTPDGVFRRYEEIRPRLPAMPRRGAMRRLSSFMDLAAEIDVFFFDAFGVLNVGETAIPGAAATVRALQALGKTTFVITNAATRDRAAQVAKYQGMGLGFGPEDVVSSREVLVGALPAFGDVGRWGVILPDGVGRAGLPEGSTLPREASFWEADGFLFLSSKDWTAGHQDRLVAELAARPRPLLVGNPDLVAPFEDGLEAQPGFYAHALLDRIDLPSAFYGKPYGNAFETALSRAADLRGGIDPLRVAMVGDTLHTDILGGAAAGIRTVLVTAHGVMKGEDPAPYIETSGIAPDFIVGSL